MTKPKIKECPSCQTLNRINLKTCSACLSHLEVKQSLKKKQHELINTSWAASVKKNRNSSRIVNSAQHSISKLNVLGYNPILFLGHQDNKGQVTGDMIHHVEHIDGVVLEILKKMRELYEDLLRKLYSLQANGSKNGTPAADMVLVSEEDSAAEVVPVASSSSSSCQIPSSSSASCQLPSPSISTAPPSVQFPTSSPPTAGATTAKKRNKRKMKAPIQTKTMVLDETMPLSGLREEDGAVIKEMKDPCRYVTQASQATKRDVQRIDEELCRQSYPFGMSLKEYEGLKFIMNKRLSHIEKQMEEVFSTYRKMWMDPTALQVVKEEEEEEEAGEGEVWDEEMSLHLNDSDDDDDDDEEEEEEEEDKED